MIKKRIALILLATATTFSIVSCSGSSDDEATVTPPTNNPTTDVNWKFGDYAYASNGISFQNLSTDFAVITASSSPNTAYGVFNGSTLTLSFRKLGTGDYYFGSQNATITNATTKIIYPSISIGTGTVNSTLYNLTGNNFVSTAKVSVTVDANGKYHVTLKDAITLNKSVNVGTGVPGAANSYSLSVANNIYGTN